MKKSITVLTLTMAAAMGLTACGSGSSAQPAATTAAAAATEAAEEKTEAAAQETTAAAAGETLYNWKLGSVDSTTNPNYEAFQYLNKLLDEKAPGRWKITIYPDSQLGDGSQQIESVQMGTLEMAAPNCSLVANYVPDYGVFDMPYLFANEEEVDKVLGGELGEKLAAQAESANIKMLGWWEVGFRCLANNKQEVNGPDDVVGLRIRVMSNEYHQALWSQLGADPVPMSLSDAYVANQNGTIDGQENPLHSLVANSTYEVCHYIAVTNHVYSPMCMIMSNQAWSSMSAEDQAIFMECMKEAEAYQKGLVRDQKQKAEQELIEKGCEVSHPDVTKFAEKMQPVYDKYSQFSDLVSRIHEAVK